MENDDEYDEALDMEEPMDLEERLERLLDLGDKEEGCT